MMMKRFGAALALVMMLALGSAALAAPAPQATNINDPTTGKAAAVDGSGFLQARGTNGMAQPAVTVAVTVTASAYSTAAVAGGLLHFTSLFPTASGGQVDSLSLLGNMTTAGTISFLLFDAAPTTTTCTDGSTVVVGAADYAKIVRFVGAPAVTATGIQSFTMQPTAGGVVRIHGTDLWVCGVTSSTFTPATTTMRMRIESSAF